MSNADFESLVGAWLGEAGLQIRLDGDLRAMTIDALVDQWEVTTTPSAKPGGRR